MRFLQVLIVGIASSGLTMGDHEVLKPNYGLFKTGYENEEPLLYDKFPEDFIWGVATASYQVSF